MIELSPYPLFWRISDAARVGLARYQMEKYGLNLEIPPYPSDFKPISFGTVSLTTEEADRIMRQRPRPRRIANL